MKIQSEAFFTPAQVADMFDVKPATVWDWIRKGKMKAIKISSRNYRVTEKQINDYITRCGGAV